jgi:hypothetical protein
VLNTILVEESNTSVNLADMLLKTVSDWNLTEIIAAVVTDNAANIKNVIYNINFTLLNL